MSTANFFDLGLFDELPHPSPPLDPGEPPRNDAAPTAIGAGIQGRATQPDHNPTPESSPPSELPHDAPRETKRRRRARVRDTSRQAYRAIGPVAGTQAARIITAISGRGAVGLTDDEGETLLGIKPQSYTPRRNELAAAGLIADSGQTRPTTSGRAAIVWVVAHATTPVEAPTGIGSTGGSGPTSSPSAGKAVGG